MDQRATPVSLYSLFLSPTCWVCESFIHSVVIIYSRNVVLLWRLFPPTILWIYSVTLWCNSCIFCPFCVSYSSFCWFELIFFPCETFWPWVWWKTRTHVCFREAALCSINCKSITWWRWWVLPPLSLHSYSFLSLSFLFFLAPIFLLTLSLQSVPWPPLALSAHGHLCQAWQPKQDALLSSVQLTHLGNCTLTLISVAGPLSWCWPSTGYAEGFLTEDDLIYLCMK